MDTKPAPAHDRPIRAFEPMHTIPCESANLRRIHPIHLIGGRVCAGYGNQHTG